MKKNIHSTIPDCLLDLVGLETGCGSKRPPPLVPIEALEGLTLQDFAQVANLADTERAVDFAYQLVDWATIQVMEDLYAEMNRQVGYRLHRELHSASYGTFEDVTAISSAYWPISGVFRGVRVVKKLQHSPMSRLYIPSVQVLSASRASEALLLIRDGNIERQYVCSLDGGQITTVPVDYEAIGDTLFIGFHDPFVQPNRSTLPSTHSCCGVAQPAMVEVRGWIDGQESQSSYGIVPQVNVRCQLSALLCAVAKHLATPILYKTGLLYSQELLHSQRMNAITIDRERATERYQRWQATYQEKLGAVLQSLHHLWGRFDPHCITCLHSRSVFARL
jgi:hypothetical protein